LFGNNLAGLLVFKVLGALALLVTIPLAVEALDSGLHLGCLGRTCNTLAVPLRLLALGPFVDWPDFLKSVVLLTSNMLCSFLISTSAILSIADNSERDLVIPYML
jgi:hypothetical protein